MIKSITLCSRFSKAKKRLRYSAQDAIPKCCTGRVDEKRQLCDTCSTMERSYGYSSRASSNSPVDTSPKVHDLSSALSAAAEQVTAAPVLAPRHPPVKDDCALYIAPFAGFPNPKSIGAAAIYAPLNCNTLDTNLLVELFTTGPFDTRVCAQACSTHATLIAIFPRPWKSGSHYTITDNYIFYQQKVLVYNQTVLVYN
ncbi:uncharacterized protein BDZ99DRAFT_502799 [Mytilinidion resinicola]|uniref:Uncharacterized protein n=1 Tax=Mytilinidion resinicola TaxID=574789 RepID=A0A6A6Y607_9PEZI|nr:uncharacterized protein BDZ99DRAFT_502799 [Mytilinidion resinicola]KAF2803963.1 hypothetical protein BDZ99DRAFT_502799 [Mytilinidion resinicola]